MSRLVASHKMYLAISSLLKLILILRFQSYFAKRTNHLPTRFSDNFGSLPVPTITQQNVIWSTTDKRSPDNYAGITSDFSLTLASSARVSCHHIFLPDCNRKRYGSVSGNSIPTRLAVNLIRSSSPKFAPGLYRSSKVR